ncbi:MAG: zinc ribbon domain-containing protein [Oscillospiraceae bacterium]|nr:zinc ribbon domain-containing protein [Oscillospiraceae bacterium]
MTYCILCGHLLAHGECGGCGLSVSPHDEIPVGRVKFCAGCGALLPSGRAFCPLCGTQAGQAPVKPLKPAVSFTDTLLLKLPRKLRAPTSVAAEKNRLSGLALILSGIIFLGVLSLVLWQYLPLIIPGEAFPLSDAVLYVQDNSRLMLSRPGTEPYEISADFALSGDGRVHASADGRYLAYRSGEALYLLDLSRLGRFEIQPREGVRISGGVTADFGFSRRGSVPVYLKQSGSLAVWDGKTETVLDDGVSRIIDIGEQRVLYAKDSPGGGSDLYISPIEPDAGDAVPVAFGVTELLDYTKNYASFLYTRSVTDSNTEVYFYDARAGQEHTLASGVAAVLDSRAEDREFIFVKAQPFSPRYAELADDPYLESDAGMAAPHPASFGLPDDFEDIYGDDDSDISEDRYSELEDAQYEAYLGFRRYVLEYDRKIERDWDRYYLRMEAGAIGNMGLNSYGLYVYRDGATHLLEDDILIFDAFGENPAIEDAFLADLSGGSVVYRRSKAADIKRAGFREYRRPGFSLAEHMFSTLPQQLCLMDIHGNQSVIYYGGAGGALSFKFTEPIDGVVSITPPRDGKPGEGNLQYTPLPAGEAGETVLVDTGVDAGSPYGEKFGEAMLYTKRQDSERADLYRVVPGQTPELLAGDIAAAPGFTVEDGGKAVLYYRRYGAGANSGQRRGDLFLYISQERMIIGDVSRFDYRSATLIYLLRGAAAGRYDLQFYREGGVAPIAGFVSHLPDIEYNA